MQDLKDMEENTNTYAAPAQQEAPRQISGMMTTEQAAEFLGIKVSYLHKLTHLKQIPYYKPFGKRMFFDREELTEILRRNRVATAEEIDAEATRRLKERKRI